jgi:hypothetical protein
MFLNHTTFKVDMSSKRVREQDLDEITFAVLGEKHGTIFASARSFFSKESADVHEIMFNRSFKLTLISARTSCTIEWRHFNNGGRSFIGAVTDMGVGQLKGISTHPESVLS